MSRFFCCLFVKFWSWESVTLNPFKSSLRIQADQTQHTISYSEREEKEKKGNSKKKKEIVKRKKERKRGEKRKKEKKERK